MNTEEIIKLADAYAEAHATAEWQASEGWNDDVITYAHKADTAARAAIEAALTAKQGEQEATHWPEAPREIYLVVCGDDDCDRPFREHGEVMWCEDRIHATDIRYVRADEHPAPEAKQEQCSQVTSEYSEQQAHVGDSRFEGWYSGYKLEGQSLKQMMRDAYAEGMGDHPAHEAKQGEEALKVTVIARSLYEITGDIKDANTVLIGRDALQELEEIAARAEAAPEAKQEPVAWWIPRYKHPDMVSLVKWSDECEPLFAHPAPSVNAQERIRELEAKNAQLLEALIDIAYGLESARIWGGMDWTYNPLHPFKYLPLRDKARAAIAAVQSNASTHELNSANSFKSK